MNNILKNFKFEVGKHKYKIIPLSAGKYRYKLVKDGKKLTTILGSISTAYTPSKMRFEPSESIEKMPAKDRIATQDAINRLEKHYNKKHISKKRI